MPASAGLTVESEGFVEGVEASAATGESLKKQRDLEAEIALRNKRANSEGSNSGSLNCSKVAKDYALYRYCDVGECDGFSSNYNLYRLCSNNDIDAMAGNYVIWRYLKEGEVNFKDYKVASKAKEQSSFSDRKRFVIYYLRGYILGGTY